MFDKASVIFMRQAKENVNHSFSNVPRRGRFVAGDYTYDETLGPIKRSQDFKATYFNIVAYNNVLLCIFIFLVIPYTIQQCSRMLRAFCRTYIFKTKLSQVLTLKLC